MGTLHFSLESSKESSKSWLATTDKSHWMGAKSHRSYSIHGALRGSHDYKKQYRQIGCATSGSSLIQVPELFPDAITPRSILAWEL